MNQQGLVWWNSQTSSNGGSTPNHDHNYVDYNSNYGHQPVHNPNFAGPIPTLGMNQISTNVSTSNGPNSLNGGFFVGRRVLLSISNAGIFKVNSVNWL